MQFKKIGAMVLCAAMALSSIGAVNVMAKDKTKIFIAGDSTACIYKSDDNYAVRREGWGMALSYMIYEDKAEVVNLAMSGRSSKSFTTEENYTKLINEMGEGDYLLIQFGHNDAKKSNDEDLLTRYTSDEGDKDIEGSFKNSLYKNYILKAQEKGANPILITPVSRNSFDEEGNCKDTHGNYDDCVRELAQELNIPCIDLTQLTSDLYNSIGETQVSMLHAIYKDPQKGVYGHDNTHFNEFGALTVAELLRTNLLKIDGINSLLRPSSTYTTAYTQKYNVTRADYAEVMARILGAEPEEVSADVFNDVKADNENAGYLLAAKNLGIIKGDDKGSFNPNAPLNFRDLAVMTERTIAASGIEIPELADTTNVNNKYAYAENSYEVLNYFWKDIFVVDDVRPEESIDLASAFSMYVNVYDLVTSEAEVEETQSIDEIEKVE